MFKGENGVETALNTFNSTFKEILPYESNITSSEYELISNRVSLSDYCLFKIFIWDNIIEFVLLIFVIVLFIFGILREAQKHEQIQIAETLYKCIVLDIKKNGIVRWIIKVIKRSNFQPF